MRTPPVSLTPDPWTETATSFAALTWALSYALTWALPDAVTWALS